MKKDEVITYENTLVSEALVSKITESNIDQIEKGAIEKVKKTITALESAIDIWDSAKEKPTDLVENFTKYKRLLATLRVWESKSLEKNMDFYTRVKRLRELVNVGKTYFYG